MAGSKSQEREKLTRTAANTIIVFLALVCAVILYGILSLGWFSHNQDTQGSGMDSNSDIPATLLIYKSADATQDIGAATPPTTHDKSRESTAAGTSYEADLDIQVFNDTDANIGPGSCGSVTAWVQQNGREENQAFRLEIKGLPINNEYLNCAYAYNQTTGAVQREIVSGFYTFGSIITPAEELERQRRALNYLGTHIALFQSYNETTGEFSGYVAPTIEDGVLSGGTMQFLADDDGDPLRTGQRQQITFYWLWINDYKSLAEGTAPIAAQDRAAILTQMETAANTGFWFSTRGSTDTPPAAGATADAKEVWYTPRYNAADLHIATTIAAVRVKLDFDVILASAANP